MDTVVVYQMGLVRIGACDIQRSIIMPPSEFFL